MVSANIEEALLPARKRSTTSIQTRTSKLSTQQNRPDKRTQKRDVSLVPARADPETLESRVHGVLPDLVTPLAVG